MTDPIYAIGDIHGQLEQLQQALIRIERDGGPNAKIIFLGDYVDRGPHSKQVLQLLIDGLDAGKNWTCLLGNHDRMFSMFMEDYPRTDYRLKPGYDWFHERIGGVDTLGSYGVDADGDRRIFQIHEDAKEVVPQRHIDFINGLPLSQVADDLLFVHAGIKPGVALKDQAEDDLVWIREGFLDNSHQHPWLVVHGHTTIPAATHYGNRVNLDSGAGYGYPLSAALFEDNKCWLLTDEGRVLLEPQD